MISLSLSEAAAAMDGLLHGNNTEFVGVSTDTRSLAGGELFFALRGPNFDGHQMLDSAFAKGAAAVVVEQASISAGVEIVVQNTRRALGKLANYWRQQFDLPVLAITGSAGKTTVKEMLGAIVRKCGPALVTRGNLNNDIGVPQTLFGLSAEHRYAVIEMGANQAGDIAYLVDIALPSVGLITLCAPAHLEGFGDIDTVARTKGEMVAGLSADGIAVLNRADDYFPLWSTMSNAGKLISFGQHGSVFASNVHSSQQTTNFELHTDSGSSAVTLHYKGKHNVSNALAAAAAALACGLELGVISDGLAAARPVPGRLSAVAGRAGAALIDDTYNANPASVAAAISVLAAEPGPRWMVFGDMGELGAEAPALHRQVGVAAKQAGVDRLFCVGQLSRHASDSFGELASHYADLSTLITALTDELESQTTAPTVLLKGSRFMGLEHVVGALKAQENATC